jgi:hypothetical protein
MRQVEDRLAARFAEVFEMEREFPGRDSQLNAIQPAEQAKA